MRTCGFGLLAILLLGAAPPAAGAPGPEPLVLAARTDRAPRLDGVLDEAAWRDAAPFDAFFQISPREAATPHGTTSLRVLHDDDFLYVGVLCRDPEPGAITRPLGRRDSPPTSDSVSVYVDAEHGHRHAHVFTVTAAGVLQDGTLDAQDRFSAEWDAVWDGAAAVGPEGWSAELAIPLRVLRFGAAPVQTWGFAVERDTVRIRESQLSVFLPRGTRGKVARLGHLGGLVDLAPRRDVEATPYLATRFTRRPQYDDAERPRPRLLDPVAEVGLDLRARLGGGLALDATLNPDFGQVEADQIILNLSRFETFFPEKRPFFTEGTSLFRAPWIGDDAPPQQLFYSRRIGLDAPILGAAKLTGRPAERLQVGLVEALVTGAGAPRGSAEDDPARGLHLDLAQPFRLAPGSAYPRFAPVTRNFLAGVARWEAAAGAVLGAQVASAVPFGPGCTAEEDALDDDLRPPRCDTRGGNGAALDADLRTHDGEWGILAQVAGSQALGGPPVRTLADGTAITEGDLGFGGFVRAGKYGGEPLRLDLRQEYAAPKLDLNAAGYQRVQNEQATRATLRWLRPRGNGRVQQWDGWVMGALRYTTDGRGLARGRSAWAGGSALLDALVSNVGCEAGLEDPQHDVREIEESGIPLVRAPWWQGGCWVETDGARAVSGFLWAGGGRNFRRGPLRPVRFGDVEARVTLRPHARAETRLDAKLARDVYAIRWIEDDGAGSHTFGELAAPTFSATLRQLLVLTPRLTLQAYAQLFSAYGRYGPFYAATARGDRPIRPADLAPAARPADDPDFHETALNLNVVARWEYRPGSTLYAVYGREAAELPIAEGGAVPHSLAPRALGRGPTTDTFLVKWTWWMGM